MADFLEDVSQRQERREVEADRAWDRRRPSTAARVLASVPTLVVLGLLLFVAGWYDLWLHWGWIALTAGVWIGCIWYLRGVWRPAAVSGPN